jgi:hypothetical protein
LAFLAAKKADATMIVHPKGYDPRNCGGRYVAREGARVIREFGSGEGARIMLDGVPNDDAIGADDREGWVDVMERRLWPSGLTCYLPEEDSCSPYGVVTERRFGKVEITLP